MQLWSNHNVTTSRREIIGPMADCCAREREGRRGRAMQKTEERRAIANLACRSVQLKRITITSCTDKCIRQTILSNWLTFAGCRLTALQLWRASCWRLCQLFPESIGAQYSIKLSRNSGVSHINRQTQKETAITRSKNWPSISWAHTHTPSSTAANKKTTGKGLRSIED